jgi:hypothetical protein
MCRRNHITAETANALLRALAGNTDALKRCGDEYDASMCTCPYSKLRNGEYFLAECLKSVVDLGSRAACAYRTWLAKMWGNVG